jgi:hypothetical protein
MWTEQSWPCALAVMFLGLFDYHHINRRRRFGKLERESWLFSLTIFRGFGFGDGEQDRVGNEWHHVL